MATLLRRPSTSLCASCSRKVAERGAIISPILLQSRGKKTTRDPNILVKLLQDIPGYGPKDAVIPVARGRMRNIWFPSNSAAYIPHRQKRLYLDQVVERNSSFKMPQKEEAATESQLDTLLAPEVKIQKLSPERTREVLESELPAVIEFYRMPITPIGPGQVDAQAPTQVSTANASDIAKSAEGALKASSAMQPKVAAQVQATVAEAADTIARREAEASTRVEMAEEQAATDASAEAQAEIIERAETTTRAQDQPSRPTIFGSVTPEEIATSCKALLDMAAAKPGSAAAARVVLAGEDIHIEPPGNAPAAIENGRIKALGEYDIRIMIGGELAVERIVRVKAISESM